MKVLTVVGARPQFIKAAAVSRVLRATEGLEEVLVHTGQHYDDSMSSVFFRELDLPAPDFHLGIGSGSHGTQTGRMLEAVELLLAKLAPQWVVVYGDTNSTLAGALAAAKCHVPVAHVESGLRSFSKRMPEEINRIISDHISDLLFAPTAVAVENLHAEGIAQEKIELVGDVMYDAALFYSHRSHSRVLEVLGIQPKNYVLATIHRAENTDAREPLKAIFEAFAAVARDIPVVLPLHPRTRGALQREGLLDGFRDQLTLVEPLGYLDMMELEKSARLIATDSGGVQKEAFFFGVPCITLREQTEWVELVHLGWNRLLPPHDAASVTAGIRAALADPIPDRPATDLYGGGEASVRIARRLSQCA